MTQIRIILVGASGSGKTTIAKLLTKLLPDSQHICELDYDDKSFDEAVVNASMNYKVKHLLIDKEHMTNHDRDSTVLLFQTPGTIITLDFHKILYAASKRIAYRNNTAEYDPYLDLLYSRIEDRGDTTLSARWQLRSTVMREDKHRRLHGHVVSVDPTMTIYDEAMAIFNEFVKIGILKPGAWDPSPFIVIG